MSPPSAPSTPTKRPTARSQAPSSPSSPSSPAPMVTTTPSKKPSSSTIETPLTPLQPISLLPTTIAATYTHIHTIQIMMLYYLNFSALVADPVPTLLKLAPQVALAQGSYMVLCLPVANEGTTTAAAKRGKAGKNSEIGWSVKLSQLVLSHLLTLLATTPLLTLLTILLGAPLTSHLPHTFLLSLHLALLITPPLFYTRGVSGTAWRQIVSVMAPWDEVMGAAVGGCVGAWLGAVPIPLDWDREWQRWPVTVVVGGVVGWGVGRTIGGVVLRWVR